LDDFYNYSCRICEPGTATFSSFFLLTKHYRCVKYSKALLIVPFELCIVIMGRESTEHLKLQVTHTKQ
jgi:hypothetical protein